MKGKKRSGKGEGGSSEEAPFYVGFGGELTRGCKTQKGEGNRPSIGRTLDDLALGGV